MILVNGSQIAKEKFSKIEEEIRSASLSLAVVQVGENKVSKVYVNAKKKELEKRGVLVSLYNLEEDATAEEIKEKIKTIKEDGIIVQLPLPEGINKEDVLSSISTEKDVDVLTPFSCGLFYKGALKTVPPVVGAIKTILEENDISLVGKNVVLVGGGDLVGKPLSLFFMKEKATFSVVDENTKDINCFTQNADVIVSGAGVPGLIKGDMIKNDTVVIDAGTSVVSGEVKGDVERESMKLKTGLFSPVPGGVGPLTIYFLAENLLKLKKNEHR
jgi:methylenetetrahydrofolate dehydrogenase (NADP+) / methenyltetrahydrofolate cyclohydrolase